jgi:hypothetical protein
VTRREKSFRRDMTFHVNRRNYGRNIPATDIDFLEYDNHKPILLWEAKSDKSRWRNGVRTSGMRAQYKLAQMAEIYYRVVENSDDWSQIAMYKVLGWNGATPIVERTAMFTLREFVEALYIFRKREFPGGIAVPDELEQIIFSITE